MRLPQRTDVLIVGAGPTGLTLAAYLHAAGIKTVIVDRAAEANGDSRAAMLHLRALELLNTLGVGKALAAQGVPISSTAYFDMGDWARDGIGPPPNYNFDTFVEIETPFEEAPGAQGYASVETMGDIPGDDSAFGGN